MGLYGINKREFGAAAMLWASRDAPKKLYETRGGQASNNVGALAAIHAASIIACVARGAPRL